MGSNIEAWVRQAKEGHRGALEHLVRHIQDRVYGLSLRMLGHPADAEDASQEILVKVITHLDSYREESAFTTWVYRVAALFRTYPEADPPASFLELVKDLLDSGKYGSPAE